MHVQGFQYDFYQEGIRIWHLGRKSKRAGARSRSMHHWKSIHSTVSCNLDHKIGNTQVPTKDHCRLLNGDPNLHHYIKGGLAHSFDIFQVCSHAESVKQWENLINHMGLIESLSSSCSPSAWEERPWKGMIICFSENWKHQGGVLFNGEICWVQLCWFQGIVLWSPFPVMFNSSPQPSMVFIQTLI